MSWIGDHSALHSHGVEAARIGHLWWIMLWIAAAVFALVMLALAAALTRRPQAEGLPGPLAPAARARRNRAVSVAVGATVAVLFVLLVESVSTGRAVASLGEPAAAVVQVTGHQWWWDVEYRDPAPARIVRTANEIHVPVGRPVRIHLRSADVIHSFWVPSLHGKRDLIPGHESDLWIEADRPGVFRGFCAEFCGHQHAHMGLLVIAETPQRFAAWYAGQLATPPPPADAVRRHGREVLESAPCAFCHTVRGTRASGSLGPDLTHLASRLSLAAASLPNDAPSLGGWIVDPQGAKPGCQMPASVLSPGDSRALVAYLGSLR